MRTRDEYPSPVPRNLISLHIGLLESRHRTTCLWQWKIPRELRVSHEKVDALHAASFLLVDADTALASLISGSLECVESRKCVSWCVASGRWRTEHHGEKCTPIKPHPHPGKLGFELRRTRGVCKSTLLLRYVKLTADAKFWLRQMQPPVAIRCC